MPEPPPSRSQASEQLDLTEDARRAAVLASRRPAWQDALAAALIALVAPAVVAYLRLQEAYEVRRLTRGDHRPYDRT